MIVTAANIDVSHEESAKEVKSTDLEEITDKSTPLVIWDVSDSKELLKDSLLLQVDSNSSSGFSFLFRLLLQVESNSSSGFSLLFAHVLSWRSNDWLWGNILTQASLLNSVLTSILAGDNNLGFSWDWMIFVSNCNIVDNWCVLLVSGNVGWVVSRRSTFSGGEENDEDCETPAISWFTVTGNTEGVDVTDNESLVSVSIPLIEQIGTLKTPVFVKVGEGIIFTGQIPLWSVFSMSCCDVTDSSSHLRPTRPIRCDSWLATKDNMFLSRIISAELSDLTSWRYMAIIPLLGIEPEKLCIAGPILIREGWVQYCRAKILEIQYWELNEIDWFLEEQDWFPDTLITSFSLLPLAWTVLSVLLSSNSKLILLAIWENGTFLCVFIVPPFMNVSATFTFALEMAIDNDDSLIGFIVVILLGNTGAKDVWLGIAEDSFDFISFIVFGKVALTVFWKLLVTGESLRTFSILLDITEVLICVFKANVLLTVECANAEELNKLYNGVEQVLDVLFKGIKAGMFFISWMLGVADCEVKDSDMLDLFRAFWDISVCFIATGELCTTILWAFLSHDATAKGFVEILEDVRASVFATNDGNV